MITGTGVPVTIALEEPAEPGLMGLKLELKPGREPWEGVLSWEYRVLKPGASWQLGGGEAQTHAHYGILEECSAKIDNFIVEVKVKMGAYSRVREVGTLGVVKQELLVKGEKKEKRLTVLFDSGASRSLIKSEVAREISTPKKLLIPREFTAVDGHKVVCNYFCDLIVEIEGKRIGIEAFLVDDLPAPLVFGALDMEAYRIKLDLARGKLDLSEFTGYMLAI